MSVGAGKTINNALNMPIEIPVTPLVEFFESRNYKPLGIPVGSVNPAALIENTLKDLEEIAKGPLLR